MKSCDFMNLNCAAPLIALSRVINFLIYFKGLKKAQIFVPIISIIIIWVNNFVVLLAWRSSTFERRCELHFAEITPFGPSNAKPSEHFISSDD